MRPSARLVSSVRPSRDPVAAVSPGVSKPADHHRRHRARPPGGPRGAAGAGGLALGAQARAGLDPEVAQLRQGEAALLLGLALPAGVLQRPDQRPVVRLLLGRDLDQPERLRHCALAAGVERDQPPPEPHLDAAQALALGDAPGAELEGVRAGRDRRESRRGRGRPAARAGPRAAPRAGRRRPRRECGRRSRGRRDRDAPRCGRPAPGQPRRRRRAPGSCSATSAARPWGRRGPARTLSQSFSRLSGRSDMASSARSARVLRDCGRARRAPSWSHLHAAEQAQAQHRAGSGKRRGAWRDHSTILRGDYHALRRDSRNVAAAPQPGRAPDRANSVMSSA